jgi:cobalamin biosynthesis protein CbiD
MNTYIFGNEDVIMNPKRIFIVGTMALTITISGGVWSKETNANASHSTLESLDAHNVQVAVKDDFLQALGASSDEEVYDSLLQGRSLADIADDNHGDVQRIINQQIAELTEQLDVRLANGSLLPHDYQAQKSEIRNIIKKSVYTQMNI